MKGKILAKSNVTEMVLRGKLMYAKVLGEPVKNFNEDGYEWKFDFIPNNPKAVSKELAGVGISDRLRSLKSKKTGEARYDGQEFMTFKQRAHRPDGTPNQPIQVEDIVGTAWNNEDLLGNETIADVKFAVIDNGPNKFKGVYPRSIRVLEHVPYQRKEFDSLDEDDPYYQKAIEAQQADKDMALLKGRSPDRSNSTMTADLDDLNDDIPID